jgi:hypothetical protein
MTHRTATPDAAVLPLLEGSSDLRQIARYLPLIILVLAFLFNQTSARSAERANAARIGDARARVATAQAEHDRLVLEEASLLDPANLGARARDLGLAAPVRVIAGPGEGL